MADVDYSWVYKETINLESITSIINPWTLFSPTQEVYGKLASGDQRELQYVVDLLGNHFNLSRVPRVKYDWSLKIPVHAVGQIRNPGSEVSVIRIPFSSVGKPYTIGATLAHEMSHQILALNGKYYPDINENEKLTDLASIAVGFGKLVLNGLALEASGVEDLSVDLGYIGNDTKLFSYLLICNLNRISLFDTNSHLAKDVVFLLEEFSLKNKSVVHRIAEQIRKTARKMYITKNY